MNEKNILKFPLWYILEPYDKVNFSSLLESSERDRTAEPSVFIHRSHLAHVCILQTSQSWMVDAHLM